LSSSVALIYDCVTLRQLLVWPTAFGSLVWFFCVKNTSSSQKSS